MINNILLLFPQYTTNHSKGSNRSKPLDDVIALTSGYYQPLRVRSPLPYDGQKQSHPLLVMTINYM